VAEELRRVARGIYPAVLADAGLVGALVDLAEDSVDLPVIVEDFPDSRYPGLVESTAYAVVRAAIANARDREATEVCVEGVQGDGVLRVLIHDDGAATPVVGTQVADQVRAIGGTLVLDGTPGRRRVEVVLPCVS
jgi:signal transduction histidine kinase